MRSTSLFGLIATLLCAGTAYANGDETSPPTGWVMVEDAETQLGTSRRFVPEGQSLESWTSLIHLQTFDNFGILLTPGEILKDSQAQVVRACPETATAQWRNAEKPRAHRLSSGLIALTTPRPANR